MSFLRNTFAVIVGLIVAMTIITLGIRINSEWTLYFGLTPFDKWENLLEHMYVKQDTWFFLALLFFSGLASTIGGIATALLVKYAKVAYAMLIGFILLFMAVLDLMIFPYHPTFYKIGVFLTFFPFSWVGGKIIDVFFTPKRKKK